MREELEANVENTVPVEPSNETPIKPRGKSKRDIFRFAGEKTSCINLEHVNQIIMEGRRISFQFSSTSMFIDLEDEAAATSVLEVVLNIWAGEVV